MKPGIEPLYPKNPKTTKRKYLKVNSSIKYNSDKNSLINRFMTVMLNTKAEKILANHCKDITWKKFSK